MATRAGAQRSRVAARAGHGGRHAPRRGCLQRRDGLVIAMNVELKRFTTNARLSQETTAFAADVWVDGKKVGWAKNEGCGGATLVHLDPSVRDQVETHGKALVPAEYARFTSGAEWIVDQLVEAELQKRSDKSFAKKIANADTKE